MKWYYWSEDRFYTVKLFFFMFYMSVRYKIFFWIEFVCVYEPKDMLPLFRIIGMSCTGFDVYSNKHVNDVNGMIINVHFSRCIFSCSNKSAYPYSRHRISSPKGNVNYLCVVSLVVHITCVKYTIFLSINFFHYSYFIW